MSFEEIMEFLVSKANPSAKQMWMRHGAKEPFYAVKIEDLKKIQKIVKMDYELALKLYDTGIGDAMYLAGLIADDEKMTKEDLQKWVKAASWSYLCEYAVPWVASGSKHGLELGLEWIDSPVETIAAAGWSTLASIASTKPNDQIDIQLYSDLIDRVVQNIHSAQNLARYSMNGFIIAVGSYIPELTNKAIEAGKKIGKVNVNMGETACKVPGITDYIDKVKNRNKIGVKRKTAKC